MNQLFQRYYDKTASEAEVQELMQWMADPANEAGLTRLMREGWEGLKPGETIIPPAKSEAMLKNILPGSTAYRPSGRIYRLWPRVAAAAIAILLLSGGAFLLLHKNAATPIAGGRPVKSLENEVLPGGNKAMLTLANGSTIVLDSAGKGMLAQQGETVVNKTGDGLLAYNAAGAGHEAIGYNTVSTPRGGQYQVVLPDGSKVWLNAASSLHFPTAFAGAERNVELTGEAYFEIKKDKDKPFHVKVHDMQVEVLGTHFNVMAYDEEDSVKTTLVEGRVKVSQGAGMVMLSPSQQASLGKDGRQLVIDKNVNIDKAVAWTNGLFYFENEDIKTIMRQLARWYDVDVMLAYDNAASATLYKYSGEISRQVPFSSVLHMLELAGGVSFKIEGNTITVKARRIQ